MLHLYIYSLIYRRNGENFTLGQPLRTVNSALHALTSFLDVGNDALFDSSQLWLQEICKTLDDEQQQQQQNNQQQQSLVSQVDTTI